MNGVDYHYQPITKDDIKTLEKDWKRYIKQQRRNNMKNYIIEAYRRLGIMLLIFIISAVFSSPLVVGLVLGLIIGPYWFFLIFGLLITIPIGIAVIMRLVDGDII